MPDLNIAGLKIVADHLRLIPPENFNMAFWRCGSVACMAGHTVDVLGNAEGRKEFGTTSAYAAHLLGLTKEQETVLFNGGWEDSTAEEAAAVLDELRTTGVLNRDWEDGFHETIPSQS